MDSEKFCNIKYVVMICMRCNFGSYFIYEDIRKGGCEFYYFLGNSEYVIFYNL